MDTITLIKALNEGKILCKKHHDSDDCLEFIFQTKYNDIPFIEMKGWGTAFGNQSDRLYDIYQFPENWKIIKDFNMKTDEYPYPWSTIKVIDFEFEK